MAKVRVQARSTEAPEPLAKAAEEGQAPSFSEVVKGEEPAVIKRAPKYTGAVDVLRKVYKENGFAGWYQVCLIPAIVNRNQPQIISTIGYGCTNHQSSLIPSPAFHVQGPIRNLCSYHYDRLEESDNQISRSLNLWTSAYMYPCVPSRICNVFTPPSCSV